ncbi:uncharacterized protein LOC119662669 [Teleopsis dalmanni]|uniref:uncharacterized protein LOC119662669 n=1 Tax=Teleopsis dalmanni TaxID=139649 RepID=UPI0018CC7DFC|nr:uncharacterized protein LOC119662669 [Teleopsis dalmanni]
MMYIPRRPIRCKEGTVPLPPIPSYRPKKPLVRINILEELENNKMPIIEKILERPCGDYSRRNLKLYYGSIDDVFNEEILKSHFTHFRENYYEKLYSRRPDVAETRVLDAKPEHINNYTTTFGKPSTIENAKDIIQPNEEYKDINIRYHSGHRDYLISHQKYFPSEQVNRHYTKPFNPKAIFGDATNVNKDGFLVKECLTDKSVPFPTSKYSLYRSKRENPFVGKPRRGFAPLNRIYGIKTDFRESTVKSILEETDPSGKDLELSYAVQHVHSIRRFIFNKPHVTVIDIKQAVLENTNEEDYYIPLDVLISITKRFRIPICRIKTGMALSHFGYVQVRDGVDYVFLFDYINFINAKQNFPTHRPVAVMTPNQHHVDTEYRDLCKGLNEPIKEIKTATKRHKVGDDHVDTVKELINRTPFSRVGLTPEIFTRLRPKPELENLFNNVIAQEVFEEMWGLCIERFKQKDKLVSIGQVYDMKKNTEYERSLAAIGKSLF